MAGDQAFFLKPNIGLGDVSPQDETPASDSTRAR